MKIAFFDTHDFERNVFEQENLALGYEIVFFDANLTSQTANLAIGFECVCAFVNDELDQETLRMLSIGGTRLIALRSAGFNNVDLAAAESFGLRTVRVPEYSPHAVAEHAVALVLSLNRKIHRAYSRVREGNFSIDGLVGFDLYQKTFGIIGAGRIGGVLVKIMHGFGCELLICDRIENQELLRMGARYVELDVLLKKSDIISLHVPLTPETKHLIDERALSLMKKGVMLINTGRGALIDTPALIQQLKSGHIGSAGLDVYEEEGVFFENLSGQILQDDQLARLMTFPNVLLTSHQAFLTKEALASIAQTTLGNIAEFAAGGVLKNEIRAEKHLGK